MSKVLWPELEARLAYQRLFDLQGGVTLQRSLYGQDKVLFDADEDNPTQAKVTTRDYERTPNLYGYLTATLRPTSALSFVLSGTYTGSMKVPHATYEGSGGSQPPS